MVHIFIINANDNPPVFALNRYDVSVTEEQGKGALVGSITVHNILSIYHIAKNFHGSTCHEKIFCCEYIIIVIVEYCLAVLLKIYT